MEKIKGQIVLTTSPLEAIQLFCTRGGVDTIFFFENGQYWKVVSKTIVGENGQDRTYFQFTSQDNEVRFYSQHGVQIFENLPSILIIEN